MVRLSTIPELRGILLPREWIDINELLIITSCQSYYIQKSRTSRIPFFLLTNKVHSN
jgi:hypothetical protein